jgi:hypothetical protein
MSGTGVGTGRAATNSALAGNVTEVKTMNVNLLFRAGLALLVVLVAGGCPPKDCGQGNETTTDVTMTPFSGRFGYGLSGPIGFVGTLTKDQLTDPAWHLEGSFSVPTGGYAVEAPEIIVAESYPEQVSVTLRVTVPAPDAIVTQMAGVIPVAADITASNEAKFTIQIITSDAVPCPDAK